MNNFQRKITFIDPRNFFALYINNRWKIMEQFSYRDYTVINNTLVHPFSIYYIKEDEYKNKLEISSKKRRD